MLIREATLVDSEAIATIYNQGIRSRLATFETRERRAEELHSWIGSPEYPLLVAEQAGEVVGWVHASSYRLRECYKGNVEFSIYVHEKSQGQHVGDGLMKEFLLLCEQRGFWKVLSRIFPENTASRALCKKHGFREVGVYEKHGKLDGVWRDVIIVEKMLGLK